jgi:hypothetical protein
MFERLPYEIIENITSYLDINQVINCMSTCRTWHRLLQFYIKKNEITICNNEQLKEIALNIKAKKLHANYICKVLMKQPFYECTEMKQLPLLFPNLQQLVGKSPSGWYKQLVYHSDSIPLGNLSSVMEHLHLERLGFFTIDLLKQFTFSRLSHLLLDFMGASYRAEKILETLKNLSSLESLELVSLAFQNTTLELLHRNVPTLKTLLLVDVIMLFESGLPTYNIEPAPRLQSLQITGDSVAYDNHLHFIKYITLKYPSVNDLVLDILYFQDDFRVDHSQQIYETYQETTLQLIDNLPRILNKLLLQIVPLKKEIVDALDSKKVHVKETGLFRDSPFSDAISVTDFFKSDMAKTVETLWLSGYSAFELENSGIESRLTRLCIRNISLNAPLNMHQLLSLHPKLQDLSIEDHCIDIDCKPTCSLEALPLKTLRLDIGSIPNTLSGIIRRCMPRLKHLFLLWTTSSVQHIYLPKHQLEKLEIQNNQTLFNCAIKTDMGMKRYAYRSWKSKNRDIKQATMLYSGTSREHSENDNMVIECKNIWHVVLNSKRII